MGLTFLLTAGGTGGHLFPAQALASELMRRGHAVELATDHRVGEIGRDFPARKMHVIASATLAGRSPLALARTAWKLGRGTLQARALLKSLRPDTVVGFGGYPTFPPMLAAWLTGTPSVLHEANAVMGRANRMLAARATAIATSFPLAGGTDPALASRTVRTGNPVRDAVIAAAAPYREPQPEGRFDLLVFGGSQGARFFSEVLPEALQCLEGHLRRRVRLVQQCRPEDLDRVKAAYDALGLEAELAPFFPDMPKRIADAHLVVCRSGASSVSELSVIGRPSILVPLPHALDNDQGRNAEVLAEAGGAWPIAQKDLDGPALAERIIDLMNAPARLAKAAAAARDVGRPDAVRRLADLVEHVASRRPVSALAQGDQSEETPS
ncbi:MAG: undecaprenyldiphospho-muramoylpentapeptide beta-N-acetylglucosaminyltransferase [Stappia sp.]|uniref:undecaprenyldiphospho-muramoylpentapeptide beta-N-acetylglucosaminyltransferase n=1 Tax=Stappia sp. TaxID=1870903 RepID=UPI000C3533BD|nr:undecaprenyldiphospho-muramoylpentapeptide beta-N-acetylglucosaminyltransferase [Stappia sp.]MAA97369.1 undecaprenyldiphospho-muramoylpentapeptide beta-N-acetylglucosaminyltransferase [Stappia sp.]MBM21902.1 undecaprenyldiphospho-muramoylpentapeptide beta-N-acetylglucosaminyltransferase [Stappia sp.]